MIMSGLKNMFFFVIDTTKDKFTERYIIGFTDIYIPQSFPF